MERGKKKGRREAKGITLLRFDKIHFPSLESQICVTCKMMSVPCGRVVYFVSQLQGHGQVHTRTGLNCTKCSTVSHVVDVLLCSVLLGTWTTNTTS